MNGSWHIILFILLFGCLLSSSFERSSTERGMILNQGAKEPSWFYTLSTRKWVPLVVNALKSTM
jgi:hypothetical protein